jgi:hypothetical protein
LTPAKRGRYSFSAKWCVKRVADQDEPPSAEEIIFALAAARFGEQPHLEAIGLL